MECKTYRTRPHAEGMRDSGYRTEEEIEEWKARDPIKHFRKRLVNEAGVSEKDLDSTDAEVKEEIQDALEFAQNSPWPDPATVTDFIFSTNSDEHT